MKQLLACLLVSSLLLTACAVTPTPDVETTVQAAVASTQAAQPTDTSIPKPTDTPAPTATTEPTDTPIPTDTPEPTATHTAEPTSTPTDTPEPTDTPAPTNTLVPTPQPTATPQPPAALAIPDDAVALSPFCNCQEQVAAGQPIVLTMGWVTVESEQAAEYVRLTRTQLTLDGQPLGDADQYWGEVMEDPDGYAVHWRYPLGTLEAGTHRVELSISSDTAFTDGFDSDGDGQLDFFGPGEVFWGWVEIVVGSPAAPPTEAPAAGPPGFDIPPGKALFVFINYTDKDWNVDIIGAQSYFLAVPPNQPGQEYAMETIAIDPGDYIWKAGSPLGFYIRGADGNTDFAFTIAVGEIYPAKVR